MTHPNKLTLLGTLLFIAIALWLPRPESFIQSPIAQAQTSNRCLAGDPYNLDALATVISSNTPPSIPVRVNDHITVQFVRSATMGDGGEDASQQGKPPTGNPAPVELPANQAKLDNGPLRIYNTRTGFEYRVTMSDTMLATIAACHEKQGLMEAGGPASLGMIEGQYPLYLPLIVQSSEVATANQPVPQQLQGWSDNDDSRILRTPTTLWPWRAIPQSSTLPDGEQSRCTLTLVGPRHLITAAHCLVNFGTSDWKARKLIPARNGVDVAPYGISRMTPNPPAGTEAWYIVPDQWLDPTTDSTDAEEYQWDIGMVLMIDRLGDQTGWMGYGAYTASDLVTRDLYNRGYPSCNSSYAERPANCQIARLYGDTELCEIGDFHHVGSNGWNREFSVSCDISRGHSGSAIYHYRYSPSKGQNVPVVVAVVSWHQCFTCPDGDDYPNHVRRITPWVRNSISWLREQFP